MNDKEMKEWNEKIKKLKEYINKNFDRGCAHVSETECKKCILYNSGVGVLDELICEFMQTEF
jgi:uncharacterized protein YutD